MRMLAERALPQDGETGTAKRARSLTVNLAESPLGWLHARRMISHRQFSAGETLRGDYERAALPQRTTMMWDAPPASRTPRGSPDHGAATTAALDAKRRFDNAVAAAGPGLSDVLWRVVCAGEAVPVAERALGWPARSGRLVLTLALDRIADYYRLK